MKKRLVAFLLVLIMVLGMLPVSAFAADDGVSPQALESNETQTIKYQILYVGDEFNIGYNYGASVNKTYTCQYSTGHSGFNHSILISEFRNVGVPALKGQLDSGYEFVGWAKEAKKNPTIFDFNTAGTTATQTTYTIYLVAKKTNPTPTYMYYLYYKYNDGTNSTWLTEQSGEHGTAATTFTFYVNTAKLKDRRGYEHIGWADKANAAAAKYTGGESITLTKDDPTKTIYAVWEGSDPIPAPSYDDLKSAIGQIQVKDVSTPSCGTENYDLIDNTQSEPFNWTKTARLDQPGKYDVTIKTAPYVAKYNSEKSKTHELNNANQTTLKLVISYENNTWKLDDGLRVIEVKHSEQTPPTDKPAKPTENDVTGVVVDIVCVTTTGTHDTVQYPLGFATTPQHTIGEVASDGAGGYICPVTVRTAWFVQQASNLVWKVQHTPTAQTITFNLTYDKNSKTWVKPAANPRIEATHEVTPDTPGDQKPNIEEANAKIRVQCIEYPSKHNPYKQNYRILRGSYEDLGWDQTEYGYIYSIRLNRAKYIAQFDQEIGRPHTDTEPNKETRINWRWENGAWHLIGGPDGIDADIKVKCAETPVKPEKPTALDGSFAIVCKNNKATHPYKADYIATPSQYTISDVQMDDQGYYVTATVTVAPNLVAYNKATRVEHRLVGEQDATLTLTFRYDTEATGDGNRKWQQQGDLPVVEVICKEIEEPTREDIFGALNGLVTVTCINRFWKDGNKNMDCGQGQYAAKAGIVGQDYTLEKGEDAGTWVVTFPVTNFVKSFKQNPAHNLYTKDTLRWYIRWENNAWTSAPVEPGVDDLVKLTHAPTDWREVAKIATGGKSDCIHTLCKNSGLNVCDYGITVPFVNFNEDVVSVVPEAGKPGSYIATFRVDKFVDARAKVCNDKNFPDAPRTHKLLTQETVQWRLYATSEADEKIGNNVLNHVWEAEPVEAGKDDVCTIAHNWVVTFNPDNGEPAFKQNVEYEGKATEPAAPEKTGYTFDGWYLDEAEAPFSFDTTITSDITLTAKWEINKYTVTFDSYGGSKVDPQVVEYGLYAQEPEEPTLKGFTFAYWYLDDENEAYDFENTPVTADITLTAKWEINKYTVTFDSYGGSKVDPQVVEYGLYAQEPEEPTLKGFTFAYWYLDDENEAYDFENTPVTADITLTAKWNINKYTVAFNTDGGTPVPPAQEVEYGLTATEPAAPEKTGYTFDGWYLGDEKYDFSAAVEQNITLTAKWQKKTFTVKYYLPDETGAWVEKKMDTVDSVDYATYSLWTPNAEDGYEFSGWYQKTADIGVKAKVEKLYMAKEWKLYGKFTPIEYTIQYVYNDGKATSTNPTTYTVESDTITLADATGADWGKTFLEWHDENGQKITEIPTGSTGNRVITAYWNWPVHLHYLDKDNNEIESATLYVSELEPGACVLPTGEKTGYDFDGWYEAKKDIGTASHKLNALSIAKKWELYGRYTAKTDVSYTVKYLREGDNKVLAPEKVVTDQTFDAEVTEQAADVVGYTPDAPSKTMILDEYNKVLTFSYSANTYDYTVRHIKQLPDGSYDEANAEVETLSGKFEALAAVTAKDYGSHYPTNDADTKQNIKIEKGLTIDVKYDLDEHTLTFETNGGSAINPVTVRHGNAVARPADPTKDKYTFIGWYADPEFTEEYDFATVLEADKTIYAKFELTSTPIGDIYVRYDVLHIKQLPDGTYDLANAEVEHLRALKDSTVTAVIKDYRATHHVNVNRTLSKLTGTAIQPYMGVDGKPVYTILSVYYDLDFHTLTFDTMGGSKIAPETVRHGLTVAKPKDPVNGGYIFDGWYTDKTFRHRYDFSTPLTEDITIYAKWFLIVLPGVTVKKNTPKLNTADHFAYVQGYPDGTVKPAGNITRAETAAILFRLMDDASRKTYYSTKSGFRDVASGSWYNTYVATLNNAGVITDSSNGYFRPNEAITRAELAAMLAKFSETTGAANYFNDVSAKYWAANAIAICAKLGWINGYPDGTFRPDKNVTRAELMAMINRATGRAPKSADAFLPGMKTWIDNTSDKWYYLDVQEATNSHSYTVKGSETWTALTSDPNWSLYE